MDTEAFLVTRQRLQGHMRSMRLSSPEGPESLIWTARATKFYLASRGVIKKVLPVNKPILRFVISTIVMQLATSVLPSKLASYYLIRKLFKDWF